MPANLGAQIFRSLLVSAGEEARRRGDRRLGTDHLLLGLLHDAGSPAATALGVSLGDLRSVADELDHAALAAVGLEVAPFELAANPPSGRRVPPLTSAARAVLKRTLESTGPRRRGRFSSTHLLLELVALPSPDQAGALLDAVGVDRAAVAERLRGSSSEARS